METYLCPLCKCGHGCYRGNQKGCYTFYHCETFKSDFYLAEEIQNTCGSQTDYELRQKMLDCIAEFLLEKPYCEQGKNNNWRFLYSDKYEISEDESKEYVNVYELLKNYPNSLIEKVEHILPNLSKQYPQFGDRIFSGDPGVSRLTYYHFDNFSEGILQLLVELDYLTVINNSIYSISALGWQKIDELQKKKNEIRQGFIAMRFGNETKTIREAFRKAIFDSGYAARIIDEKEHNNQIVPEIFYEIGRSKFVVVDVTFPNYGAYYEAGYAQAIEKQVIVCCRKKEFDDPDSRPHFDIAQKSMIVWNDEEDLVERLKKRIEATVK